MSLPDAAWLCGLCCGEAAGRCWESGGQDKRFELALFPTALGMLLWCRGAAGMLPGRGANSKVVDHSEGWEEAPAGAVGELGGWRVPGHAGASPKHSGSC